MPPDSARELHDALVRMGLASAGQTLTLTALTGGVSSDIYRADLPSGAVCIKRALSKLRVESDWHAPTERNRYEVAYLRFASTVAPGAVPPVLAADELSLSFAMPYLAPERYPVWKSLLRDGRIDPGTATRVGQMLARIHAASAGRADLAAAFATDANFHAIRLEPYLEASARRHPDLADPIARLVERTAGNRLALVHGDVSPKNILCGPRGPVLLDAECAWYGDPAFDAAFALNHLLLKCIWRPLHRDAYLHSFAAFAQAYFAGANWEPTAALQARVASLLPALLLARIDGKSPVEYITEDADRDRVRAFARPLIAQAADTVDAIAAAWRAYFSGARPSGDRPARPDGDHRMTSHNTSQSAAIAAIAARRVWDSRARPTIEVEVRLRDGATGRAIAPAGASRGSREAIDRRDGGSRLGGFDVQQAIGSVTQTIAPALTGLDATDQRAVDAALLGLDPSPTKSLLGGNALIAVSMACAHAAAAHAQVPLYRYLAGPAEVSIPLPEIQIFGGGAHAGRRIDIQDLMVVAHSATSVEQALEMTAEVYRVAGEQMRERGLLAGVADEGGHWPAFDSNEQALEALLRAIEGAGYTPGQQVAISLDIAASEFGANGRYRLGLDRREIDSDGMVELLSGWLERFPVCSIEDPLAEDDTAGMQAFTRAWGSKLQVIGDDFIVTNAALIEQAAAGAACNTALIKPNQAGTLTETRAAFDAARRLGWYTIVSARSGETEDTTVCDLAIGWNARQLKVGSIARGERTVKWNALIRAEQLLGTGRFAGGSWLGLSC